MRTTVFADFDGEDNHRGLFLNIPIKDNIFDFGQLVKAFDKLIFELNRSDFYV